MPSPPAGILRYPSDLRPVTMVCLALALSLAPLILQQLGHLPSLPALVALWLVSLYVRTAAPYAQHNHGHLPAFRSAALNGLFDTILTQVTGYPTALWELHHNRGHHRTYLDPYSDVAGVIDPRTGRLRSRLWYAVRGNLTIVGDSYRIAQAEAARGRPAMLRKLGRELLVQLVLTAALLWWSPVLTLAYFIVPNLMAGFMVWWESYVHHIGVPGQGRYDSSVTVTGWRFNFLNFNIGHHTAHHEKPTLHWSLLPARTAAIAAQIPPECVRETPGPGLLPVRVEVPRQGTQRPEAPPQDAPLRC